LRSEQLLLPVIVVGNINVGGTGKTPLTLALAQHMIERGWHPVIVSRGYGSKAVQPRQVRADSRYQDVGDEPLLMARRNLCPVWIGTDRAQAAHQALKAHPECDVVLCDDGLQHYRLHRDVEIAVVDGLRRFGNGLMLPAGPLREPASRLNEVDAVVMNGDAAGHGQYAMSLHGQSFYNVVKPDKTASPEQFRRTRNHAAAGIGNPDRYFLHLKSLGIPFTAHAFPDHYPFRANDLSFPDCDAVLLTEKDAVKCVTFADERYWALRVDAHVDPALLELILEKIKSHGSQAA
jgi:tetraacyldisaccharide 4'-kinase